jgi:acetyltransferase-like isoleucine patch superfamily enzyme
VRIEDDVFVGHNVTFINDRHPSAEGARTGEWTLEPTVVRTGVSIGSGAVILCGLTIGERARIGAGAVVTHDVPPDATVAGVPAEELRTRTRTNDERRTRTRTNDERRTTNDERSE